MKKKREYFVGVEAEGDIKGRITLFIAACIYSPDTILMFLNNQPEINAVYFGANGTCVMWDEYARFALTLKNAGYTVTCEVKDLQSLLSKLGEIPSNIRIVIPLGERQIPILLSKCISHGILYFKEEDDKTILLIKADNGKMYETKKDSINFFLDKEVEF